MSKHIVMIEDDSFITQMYSIKLENKGYEVHVCETGEEGYEYIKERAEDVDLILLDIILPGKSGVEVLEEVMKDETLQNIPVVMLSNLASQSDVDKCLELGAKDYVVKANYTPEEISGLIQKYIT